MLGRWDVFVDASSRRKGLGRHLMMLLELIARREGMHVLALPVQVRTHKPFPQSLLDLSSILADIGYIVIYSIHSLLVFTIQTPPCCA